MRAGDVAWSAVPRLLDAAAAIGADRAVLARRLPDPARHDDRLELLDYCRLGQLAISGTGRGDLGLEIARRSRISHLGLPGLAALCAPTLGDALALLSRCEPLSVRSYRGESSWVATESRIAFYSIAPYNDFTRFVVDAMLGTWYRTVTALAEADVVREVRIEFAAPAHHAAYAALFRCPVYFAADENAVLLRADAARLPLPSHDETLFRELAAQCDQRLRQLSQESRFAARVQKVIGPMLSGNTPSLEDVASALGMASWTLRRKLKEENTSFQDLLDDMRRDLALAYMTDVGLSLGEIAYILGFSTPGAFQRAFKRWTGTTPGDYRRRLRES